MYAYIQGAVTDKTASTLVIDAGGVGYEILCTASTLSGAPARGEIMRVYTWLSVREDAMELLGFCSYEEKGMFLRLTAVSGIGPRTALAILGSMPLRDLTMAVMTNDVATLMRAPGIGKKTAQRLVLELKDKLSADDLDGAILLPGTQSDDTTPQGAVGEAILALQSLGYTQSEAARAVSAACKAGGSEERADELVRLALRGIMKG